MPDICALGYVRVRVTDMERWRAFAGEEIGFAFGEGPEEGALYLRIDERPARIILLPGDKDRLEAVGFEVPDAAGLAAVREAVEAAGVGTKPLGQDLLDIRRVEDAIAFEAPGGSPIEVFHGAALDHSPVAAPYGNRFVAGQLGLGHAVLPTPDIDGTYDFFKNVLGFFSRGSFRLPQMPGMPEGPVRMRFMGVNPRHHSLAIFPSVEASGPGLVHVMVEVETLDEVGRALDRVIANGSHVTVTLGRHTNDKMVSFYVRTPGGWDLEVGCDGYMVDQESYSAEEITADSYWGHAWHAPAQA
jgi:3,4-dihydroxy-9,10-secoandrosta-1,3,5(10)-triene-9,17-dione 4,5-dioxygenase